METHRPADDPRSAPVIAALETAKIALRANPELTVHGARGSHSSSTFTIIRITSKDDICGYGEVSATPLWSGEDHVTAAHMVRDVIRPILVGQPLSSVPAMTRQIDATLAGNPFTKAGINMALWDLAARSEERSVVELLGGPFRRSVPVKLSLSGDAEALEGCLAAARSRGFNAYKVKVGLDVDGDIARFALARSLVGAETFLGADANGGWSRFEASSAIPRLRELGARFIEQPVAAPDIEGLHALRRFGLPVLADESAFSLSDVVHILRADAADAVSIYVGKIGGLEDAVFAARMLNLWGVDALIGSNGEMGIGAAAQIHVACALERLSPLPSDIIGHHYYDQDTLVEPVNIDGARAHLPTGAGLGVEPDPAVVKGFS
jgi:L-alanine-DL-glutamate epimerase-like enolase superfamily enzyme